MTENKPNNQNNNQNQNQKNEQPTQPITAGNKDQAARTENPSSVKPAPEKAPNTNPARKA